MRKSFKILGSIFYGAVVVTVVVVAGALIATMIPIPGNIEVKIVKSGSMEPAIPTGSVVVIKPAQSYEVGQVITFGRDTARDIPTTHRIVEIKEEGGKRLFTTKGDANEENDQKAVLEKEIIGTVLLTLPRAGFILDFARTRLGFITMIVIPAAMVIIDEGLTIFGEVRGMRRRKTAPRPVVSSEALPARKQVPVVATPKVVAINSQRLTLISSDASAFTGIRQVRTAPRPVARTFPQIDIPSGLSGITIRHA